MEKDRFMVMLTDYYPYGMGEAFLETEVEYLQGFRQVLVFPWHITRRGARRQMPSNFTVVARKAGAGTAGKRAVRGMLLWETAELFRQGRLSGQTAGVMGEWYQRAREQAGLVLEELERRGVSKTDSIVCYSYWMNAGALALILIRQVYRNAKLITRCHRYDLYEERNTLNYLPFRQTILRHMDQTCPISENGKKYLTARYRIDRRKIKVSRLGTRKKEILFAQNEGSDRSILRLVSCSSLIAVKRVYRIVQELQRIDDIRIEWTHFGGGPQFEQIRRMCRDRLGKNITYNLEGHVPNETVLGTYQSKAYHIFLNTSASEGIPVSIMEAMSFGTPVIATDVGGTSEIVRDRKNGFLLDKEFKEGALTEAVRRIADMPEEDYIKMRVYARRFWNKYYNADQNYPDFVENILRK